MTNKLKYFIGNWKMFGDLGSFKIINKVNEFSHDTINLINNLGHEVLECAINNTVPIINNLSKLLKNTDWENDIYEDDKGKYDLEYILLETGEYVSVECYDWSTDTENNLEWVDNLQVRVSSAEWEEMKNDQQ